MLPPAGGDEVEGGHRSRSEVRQARARIDLEALARVGGIDAVQRHATCLAAELRRRLLELAHANGAPLAVAYGEKETTSTVVTFNVLDDAGRCVGAADRLGANFSASSSAA